MVFKDVTDQFVAEHPDFCGGKFIYAPHRFAAVEEISQMYATHQSIISSYFIDRIQFYEFIITILLQD